MLLISVAATGSLSEVEQKARTVANLKSRDGRCPLTGQKTFVDALTDVVRYEALYDRTSYLLVESGGDDLDAEIVYYDKAHKRGKQRRSTFGKGNAAWGSHPHFVASFLALPPLLAIPIDDFAAMLKETNK
jgi:hypothetical protein